MSLKTIQNDTMSRAQMSAEANPNKSSMITLKSLPILQIRDDFGNVTYGAKQTWYSTEWQRRAGCGPTAASTLFRYLSRTLEGCEPLCPFQAGSQRGFQELMEHVWHYVTPGQRGLNKTSMMVQGAVAYAESRGVALRCDILEIPRILCGRPSREDVAAFLTSAIQNGLPAAFLNLSNGKLTNLDSWHWVTIVGFDPRECLALIYDQGHKSVIDLALWLRTTLIGGGFVTFSPFENNS